MLVLNRTRAANDLKSAGLVSLDDVRRAQERVRGVAMRAPLLNVEFPGHGRVFIKAESLQPVGSFKLRGAYNKAATFSQDQVRRGLIAYSSGNHAQGVAYVARAMGTRAVIVMPSTAPEIKRRAVEALGAEIVTVGPASQERRAKAEELAAAHGYAMIPPYDDAAIIAGQGTCGLEILEDLPDVEIVLVPVGGGGLLSGIVTAIKRQRPEVEVLGVEPELAADAAESVAKGSVVSHTVEHVGRTLADGLRTQQLGELNFAHIRALVDGMVTVTEKEILQAMRAAAMHARLVAEPSGAVPLAAALYHADELSAAGKKICVVLSGGNADPKALTAALALES